MGLIGTMVAGLFYSFVSYQSRFEYTLPDGSVAICDVLIGSKVSKSDFERDMYAYRDSWFQPRAEGLDRLLGILKVFKREPERYRYFEVPVLVLEGIKSGPSKFNSDRPVPMNAEQLPMASKQWNFGSGKENENSLSRIAVSNPLFHRNPRFEGKQPPLESKSAKGALKLVSANFTPKSSKNENHVSLVFDASGCPALLPCQVIGVRLTDSWGNTRLIGGHMDRDGKTIRVVWEKPAMQSPDWDVRMAVCRGRGAAFSPAEVVVFERLITNGQGKSATKRFPHGRELKLEYPTCRRGSVSDAWKECWLSWKLDDRGPFLWPIVTKVVGHTADGGSREINPADWKDPSRSDSVSYWANYWIKRERSNPDSGKAPSYSIYAGLAIPPDLVEYDLHVTLEEPTVFEFKVKVSDWPSPKKEDE